MKAERARRRYRTDPVAYAAERLQLRLTPEQQAMLRSLVHNRRTAVKASHAIGKTFLASVAACWWYDCWPEHIVYITAPSWDQALGLTFKNVKRLRRERKLRGQILETGIVRDPDKVRAASHFIKALNAETGEGFQGEHAAPILIILEEAVGVPRYIWEAAKGLMTHPDCRMLAIANPTDEATEFGENCGSRNWTVQTVSVLDHVNIRAELQCQPPPFPLAVRLQWLYEMLVDECEVVSAPEGDAFEFYSLPVIEAALRGQPVTEHSERWYYLPNAIFQGRALGMFPTQADQQVVPRGWLESLLVLAPEGVPEIGCDSARFGSDRTTIALRWGPCVLLLNEIRQMSQAVVTGALIQIAQVAGELANCSPKAIPMRIDVTGGLGTGPADFLAEAGYAVVAVNSSETALQPEKYYKVRSELWFATRERARAKRLDLSRLPREMREKLIRELSAPTWKPDTAGRRVVQSKEEIKKKLGYSPDLADAVNLSFAPYQPGEIQVYTKDDLPPLAGGRLSW